jgi:signal transduction histidine kinase/ActR/RegA family two-component response regulator
VPLGVRTLTSVGRSAASDDASEERPAAEGRALRVVRTRHLLPALVLLVVAGISIGTFFALRGVVRNQEKRLLNERATEVAAFLGASTTQTTASLQAAGAAVAVEGKQSKLFQQLAAPLIANGGTVGVAQQVGGVWVVQAVTGNAVTAGQPVTSQLADMISRATSAKGLVFNFIPGQKTNLVVEGMTIKPASTPTVVFLQLMLPPPTPITPTSDSPYRELNAVLYASHTADPRKIVLISGSVPSASALTARKLVSIGGDSVLVVISPHGSLVGATAEAVPWIVLAGGLLLAVLLAVLVEVLTRRRAYALNLVEQRTRAMHQAQLAAEAANQSKSEFLSRMSHELRTPLNAVLGFSQLLELDRLTPDQDQAVDQITRGGRHLLDLINEILDISQIETGKLTLSPEAVNVREVVSESVDLVRPLADERGVHLLGGELGACDQHVFADRQRIKQILLNLLGNGIKYNRDGGTVSISCSQPTPGRLRIQVTDTGPGIPKEQFELLFTPFERLGAEQSTIEGTGIGLALSRRLAEVMGGTLDVESTVGRGSTFYVEFPIVEAPLQRVERLDELGATPIVTTNDTERPSVLHIEDNLSNIKLIERVLAQRPGMNLIPAMQGRLGLELARQHRPVLILLDLNLADIAGEEVLHMLRDDPMTAGIPVAIVSADAMPRQVQRMLAAGATAYLTKPIDVRELLDLVDKALALYARRTDAISRPPAPGGG